MHRDLDEATRRAQETRHRLTVPLTVIQGRVQLLQRKLERMDGLEDGHKAQCVEALAAILAAASSLAAEVDRLTAPGDPESRPRSR